MHLLNWLHIIIYLHCFTIVYCVHKTMWVIRCFFRFVIYRHVLQLTDPVCMCVCVFSRLYWSHGRQPGAPHQVPWAAMLISHRRRPSATEGAAAGGPLAPQCHRWYTSDHTCNAGICKWTGETANIRTDQPQLESFVVNRVYYSYCGEKGKGFNVEMSIGYQLFGIPTPNRYQLGIWYFSPNVLGILLVSWILANV